MNTLPSQPVYVFEAGIADEVSLELPAQALLVRPAVPVGVGVLVLLGSSGRMDVERARLLGRHGAHAMALRWFGGEGQAPGVCEIPIELFVQALDRLGQEPVDSLAVIGFSKGAEAALLLACVDDRVDLTVAMSPPSVVWANLGPGVDGKATPYRSSWTWRGEPLPFVGYDDHWKPTEGEEPIAYRGLYEQSLLVDPDATEAAAIPIEEARGDIVLVAGHDDALWPSVSSVRTLAQRRVFRDHQVEVLLNEQAGHSPLFPGESIQPPSPRVKRGGTPQADAELGAAAWATISQRLGLSSNATASSPT